MLQPVAFEAATSLISGVLPMLSMKPDRTSMTCSLCWACASRTDGRQGAGPKATGLAAALPSRSVLWTRFPRRRRRLAQGIRAISASVCPTGARARWRLKSAAVRRADLGGGVVGRTADMRRSSARECRQAYATTLLRSVQREVSWTDRIILSYRDRGRGASVLHHEWGYARPQ